MTKNKPTPGPWAVSRGPHQWQFTVMSTDGEICKPDSFEQMRRHGVIKGCGIAKANAQFIAAAPKMYALVKRILSHHDLPGDFIEEAQEIVLEFEGTLNFTH